VGGHCKDGGRPILTDNIAHPSMGQHRIATMSGSTRDRIRAALARNDERTALKLACMIGDDGLGQYSAAIHRAHEAAWHPRFARALGDDPQAVIADGIVSLRALLGIGDKVQSDALVFASVLYAITSHGTDMDAAARAALADSIVQTLAERGLIGTHVGGAR
jgi:hypothetical protein